MATSPPATSPNSRERTASVNAAGAGDVDSLWGMAVLLTVVAFLSTVIITNAPFFFVRFMDTYGATHETASWPVTIVTLVSNIAGAGMGILLICLSIYTMDYFDKYRGTVSGLKYVGMSCSGLVFPVMLAKLVDVYGVKGTLLILGGLTMNTMPLILLFEHPAATMRWECLLVITQHVIKARDKGGFNKEEDTRIRVPGIRGIVEGTGEACVEQVSSGKICTNWTHPSTTSSCNVRLSSSYPKVDGRCTTGARRNRSKSDDDAAVEDSFKSSKLIAGIVSPRREQPRKSTKRERGIDANPQTSSNNEAATAIPQKTSSLWAVTLRSGSDRFQRSNSTSRKREKCFRHERYEFAFRVVMNSMVAYAVDKGSNLELADTLVMFAAVSGIVGRLLLPMLSDMLGLSRDVFAACNILVVALCLALLAEVSSHILFTALVMGVSMSAGTVLALKPVLVAEYVGVSLMTATLGVMGVLMVPVMLTGPLLVGLFRDRMGSFDNLYRLQSAMNLFIALILFALAFYRKLQGNRLAGEKK
ncbi:hypothetical protein HPB50_001197 [Hyalomma asiaticum]|uniref:Uncharacterized protein n=1 Tax=Hyalomma asiaticum TaxID=266040 RepID=A0ACB7SD55_HYAAI|nr:hypothetical protein HPB50_001197 [Hyalomma asiaticum]